MKYKIAIFAILLCLSVFLSSCTPAFVNANESNSPLSDTCYAQPLSFEEALERSTHIILAEYKDVKAFVPDNNETSANTSLLLLTFSPISSTEQIKGSKINGDFTVSVPSNRIDPSGQSLDFEAGRSYWLVLERSVNVCREDVFYQTSFWSLSGDADETSQYVREYLADKEQTPDFVGNDYIRSTDLQDIVSGSPIIIKVKIRTTEKESLFGIVRCNCTVSDVLKGETDTSKVLTLSFPKGTELQKRKEYIVLLDEQHDLSSKNSVYSVKDTEAIEQIQKLISNE